VIHTDTVVIGAGPVGLFQVFQLGLLGMSTQVIDVLPEAGGQCVALYPDKPIYDVPGVPRCTGRELTDLLLAQARPFLAPDAQGQSPLHLGHQVSELNALTDGGFEVRTLQGLQLRCRAVFVAAGAGAFVPRLINVAGLNDLLHPPANVHHHWPLNEPCAGAGQAVVVAGGGEEAVLTVLDLLTRAPADAPASLTLLHRREQFQVEAHLQEALQTHIDRGRLKLALGMPTAAELDSNPAGQPALRALTLLGNDSQEHRLPLDVLLVRQGLSPKLGPLTQWGLALERKQVSVSPCAFESSVPGVFAVGDINTYPGKKRLLLCGFHEATLAAHAALARLHPEAPQHLQYTTTSALLRQRLGVSTAS